VRLEPSEVRVARRVEEELDPIDTPLACCLDLGIMEGEAVAAATPSGDNPLARAEDVDAFVIEPFADDDAEGVAALVRNLFSLAELERPLARNLSARLLPPESASSKPARSTTERKASSSPFKASWLACKVRSCTSCVLASAATLARLSSEFAFAVEEEGQEDLKVDDDEAAGRSGVRAAWTDAAPLALLRAGAPIDILLYYAQ